VVNEIVSAQWRQAVPGQRRITEKTPSPRLIPREVNRDWTTVAAGELETQALNWLVRSEAPDCTDAERAKLETWLASPRHRAAYIRIRTIWAQADQLRRLQPLDGSVDPDLLEPGSPLAGGEPTSNRALHSRTTVIAYILVGVLLTVLVSGITAWIVSETLLRPKLPP